MPPAPKAAQILVVDDDEGLLILMAETLRAEGFRVATADSGASALQWLQGHTPDLMLLDLKMRDFGGPQLLERLGDRRASIPFIVITGQGDAKGAAAVMKQGALDYVTKDMGLLDLLPGVVKQAVAAIEQNRVLERSRAEQRRLEGEILQISEREQRRIGEDLHDGIGQQLTAIELLCAGIQEDAARHQPALAGRLAQMGQMLRAAIGQTRLLARGLVPIGEGPDALRNSMAELAEGADVLGRGRLRCRLECPATVPVRDRAVAGHLFRIAQEAVNNALKHAHATLVTIRLTCDTRSLELRISDDGKGLPKVRSRGLGLGVMRHRASVIGARLAIASKPGQGVTVTCTLPLPA